MAKRLIDWEVRENVLEMREYVKADSDEIGKVIETFNIDELFTEIEGGFMAFNEVQQYFFVYGLKQKLADCGSAATAAACGSREAAIVEKAGLAREKFDAAVRGELKAPAKTSAAKENKRVNDKVKKAMAGISLESLTLKKLLNPETFTEEDQAKLEEFQMLQAEHLMAQKENG